MNGYNEDLMPRNAPKPAPLIEVTAKPLVPEVSLLLDQEKNKSFHLQASSAQCTENKAQNNFKKQYPNEITLGNQFESYNTWKAKNAQALYTVTGSLGRTEIASKHSALTRKPSTLKKRSGTVNEICNPQESEFVASSPIQAHVHEVSNKNSTGEVYKKNQPLYSNNKENFEFQYSCINHQISNSSNKPIIDRIPPPNDKYPLTKESENYPQMTDMYQVCKECESQEQSCSTPKVRQNPTRSVQEVHAHNFHPNIHACFERNAPNNTDIVKPVRQNYYRRDVNQRQCHCGPAINQVCPGNETELTDRENVCSKKPSKPTLQITSSNVISPIDMAQINNQTVIDLYQIIHLQNEQILMLQQQVKQVLQIHLDCNKMPVKQVCECQSFSSRPQNNQNSQSDTNKHFEKIERTAEVRTVQEQMSPIKTDCEKRMKCSVGVMTSLTDNHSNLHCNKSNSQAVITNTQNFQKQQHKQPTSIFPSDHHKKKLHSKRKIQHFSANSSRKKNVEHLKVNSRADNSFSLNEAELVIRTPAEQEDSPNNSVHVDLQDYYTSSTGSNESDTSGSSSGEDESEESEPDEESSDPQLGWTFYNRVVGQVNNILKKAPTPPQHDHTKMSRPAENLVDNVNGDCETENNWSKRVTFHGPPLEDSDNNIQHMVHPPKYQQPRPKEALRENDTNRGPKNRMQDFMMYNFANGNTNLSFATLRYLERYHLLPSQMGLQMPGELYQGCKTNNKQYKKKKNKSRHLEEYSHVPRLSSKRRSSVPSSKLLDVTALKQQPKLF